MAISQKEQDYLNSIKNNEKQDTNEQQVITEKLSRSDRELVIVYNEEEGVFYADTSIPKFWRRLEKKNWICINTQYYSDGTVCCKTFKGSKKGITITDPFKKRELTDEQKQAIRDRFSKTNDDEEDIEDEIE